MNEKNTDKFLEEVLKLYFKMNKYYCADELYDEIVVREKKFEKLLNKKQRIEYVKLRAMFERYDLLVKQDSFSHGFFEGYKLNEKDD